MRHREQAERATAGEQKADDAKVEGQDVDRVAEKTLVTARARDHREWRDAAARRRGQPAGANHPHAIAPGSRKKEQAMAAAMPTSAVDARSMSNT